MGIKLECRSDFLIRNEPKLKSYFDEGGLFAGIKNVIAIFEENSLDQSTVEILKDTPNTLEINVANKVTAEFMFKALIYLFKDGVEIAGE